MKQREFDAYLLLTAFGMFCLWHSFRFCDGEFEGLVDFFNCEHSLIGLVGETYVEDSTIPGGCMERRG